MLHYLAQWGHWYVIHYGIWMSLLCFLDVQKNGMPALKDIWPKIKIALLLAAVLSIFSSHSHHYLTNILPKI